MSERSRKPRKGGESPVIAAVIVFALIGLAAVQLLQTKVVDKYLIAALVVLALAFGGYGVDRLLEAIAGRYLDRQERER